MDVSCWLVAGFSPEGWPSGENPTQEVFRLTPSTRQSARQGDDLRHHHAQTHDAQIEQNIQKSFFHRGLLVFKMKTGESTTPGRERETPRSGF